MSDKITISQHQQAVAELRKIALQSPGNLAALLGFENNWHHREWYNILSNPLYKKIITLAPRNHAKSTVFSCIYPLWEVARNPNVRILIVSNTASQSEQFLRQTTTIIESNPIFREVIGDLVPPMPDKWSSRAIIVERNTVERDPTIATLGAGGAILSRRADIIICDDILNKENTATVEQRRKLRDWFDQILLPVLEPNGKIIVVGTAFNLDDLYHDLLKDPTYDFKRKYQAIIKEADDQEKWMEYKRLLVQENKEQANTFYFANKAEMDVGAEVLWNARMDYKLLFDMRISNGVRAFNLMYQNKAISSDTAIFQEEWIEKCKNEKYRLIDHFDQARYPLGIFTIVSGVDLAVSEKALADYTVITTIGKSENKYVVLNRVKGHFSPSNIRRNIETEYNRFKPSVMLVEDNAFQASLKKDMQDFTTVPVKGFTTSGEKYDEFIGVNSLAVTIENGQWILPADPTDPKSKDFYQEIKEEMMSFPSGHTGDTLMSLWFAFTAMRSIKTTEVVMAQSTDIRPSVTLTDDDE